MNVM